MPSIPAGALPAGPQAPVLGRQRELERRRPRRWNIQPRAFHLHGRRMPRQPRAPVATPGNPGSRTGPRASRAGCIIPHGPADTPTPAAAPGSHSTSTPLRRPRASHAGSPLAPVPWRRGVHPESSPRGTSEGAGTVKVTTVTAGRQQLYTPLGCRSHRCPPVAAEYRESANRLPHDGHRRVPAMYPAASDHTSTARRSPQSEHRGYALLPSNGTPPHESLYRPSGSA